MPEPDEVGAGDGGRRRRAGARVEEAELTEHLAGAEYGEQVLAAVGGAAAELHLAGGDDVEPIAGLALLEQHVTTFDARTRHALKKSLRILVAQRSEEGGLTHNIDVHLSILPRFA